MGDSPDDALLGFVTVEKEFGDIGESNLMVITAFDTRVFRTTNTQDQKKRPRLSRSRYLSVVLHSWQAFFPVGVVKRRCDRCLGDAVYSTFIYENLLILRTHLREEDMTRRSVLQGSKTNLTVPRADHMTEFSSFFARIAARRTWYALQLWPTFRPSEPFLFADAAHLFPVAHILSPLAPPLVS